MTHPDQARVEGLTTDKKLTKLIATARHLAGDPIGAALKRIGPHWPETMNELADALSELLSLRASPSAVTREPSGETLQLIEDMVAGVAPMSRWMASVDYHSFAAFEEYLKAQLREKLQIKAFVAKRDDDDLKSFVDGGTAALEGALATYRVVMASEASAPEPETQPVEGWRDLPRATQLVSRLREIFNKAHANEPGYQTDKEIYSAMHTQVLQLLACDPASSALKALEKDSAE